MWNRLCLLLLEQTFRLCAGGELKGIHRQERAEHVGEGEERRHRTDLKGIINLRRDGRREIERKSGGH